MDIDFSSIDVQEALATAIKSEIEAEDLYKKLKEMVSNFVIKDKLDFLISEEKKHQQVVRKLYAKMFSDEDPALPEKSLAPRLTLALKETESVPDLLEVAIDAEKKSEEFYDALSQEVTDRGAQEILQYLASMEHGHYSLLKGEYELCKRDEQYYERDDFQYDMVHIGP
ncbi:MAG: ferritin family protein [bacterium]